MYCYIKKSLLVLKIILLMTPFVIGGYDIYIKFYGSDTFWHLNTDILIQEALFTRTKTLSPACDPERNFIYDVSDKGIDRIQMDTGEKEELLRQKENEDIVALKVDLSNGDVYFGYQNVTNPDKYSLAVIPYGYKRRKLIVDDAVEHRQIFIRNNGLTKELYWTYGNGQAVYKVELPDGKVNSLKNIPYYNLLQITDDWMYFEMEISIVKYSYNSSKKIVVQDNIDKLIEKDGGSFYLWFDETNFYLQKPERMVAYDLITVDRKIIYTCNNFDCYGGPVGGFCFIPTPNKVQNEPEPETTSNSKSNTWVINGSFIRAAVLVHVIFMLLPR